jgi:hypothetical protein
MGGVSSLGQKKERDMAQEISEKDVILVSDSGAFYVVKMKDREPVAIEPLAPVFQQMPKFMRDSGVTMAHLPQHAFPGGATCYLVNLQSLRTPAPAPTSTDTDDKNTK